MAETYHQQNIAVAQQQPVVQDVNPVQQQIAVVGQQPHSTTVESNSRRHRHIKVLRGLGITECILGGLSVLLAAVADAIVLRELRNYRLNQYGQNPYYDRNHYLDQYAVVGTVLTYVSQGIWCGIFIIMTGILGIRITNTPSRVMYIANMAIAIVTAITCFSGGVISGLAAGFSTFSEAMVALHSVITILITVSVCIAIAQSAFCCSGVCNSIKSVSTQQVVYLPQINTTQPQPQYVRGPNGQLMMMVNQTITPQMVHQVPQASTFQQDPVTANAVMTPMPLTSAQKLDGTSENASEKAPPAPPPVV